VGEFGFSKEAGGWRVAGPSAHTILVEKAVKEEGIG